MSEIPDIYCVRRVLAWCLGGVAVSLGVWVWCLGVALGDPRVPGSMLLRLGLVAGVLLSVFLGLLRARRELGQLIDFQEYFSETAQVVGLDVPADTKSVTIRVVAVRANPATLN